MGLRSALIRWLGGTNGHPPAVSTVAVAPAPVVSVPAPVPGLTTATTATWQAPDGRVRATYRTTYTGADEFSRTYLAMELSEDGRSVRVNAEELGRWCLERFVVSLDVREGGKWITHPFTWAVLESLPLDVMRTGWAPLLALHIWQTVVNVEARNLEALKKTPLSATAPASPDGRPAAQPSPTSILSGPPA